MMPLGSCTPTREEAGAEDRPALSKSAAAAMLLMSAAAPSVLLKETERALPPDSEGRVGAAACEV